MTSKERVRRLAAWSIAVAFAVMGLKFVSWWVTGSVALFSDALESIVNVIAATVAFVAIRVSHTPADDDHPFGHHKAEYLSAVLEGVLIVVAALLIFREAAAALFDPPAIEAPAIGLAINMLAAACNAAWAWLLIRTGRRERSPALIADGHHINTDVVTSVGVAIGLVLALVTGWLILDPILAIIVALNILWQGWRVISESVQGLMDRAVEPSDGERIAQIIGDNAGGSIEVHDIKTRVAGRATFVEFHLVVDALMTVQRSHEICDRIEAALKNEIASVQVVIHVEPETEAKFA
jgi:cation diffusion facilitator family transporter